MKKKTSIYPSEKNCLLEKNIIHKHFKNEFDQIVDKFNDYDFDYSIIQDDNDEIQVSEAKDYSFFEEYYTPSKKIETIDPERNKKFPDIHIDEIGESEWELISFSSIFGKQINNRICFVLGNIGEGKSTLINYVFRYLYNTKRSLKNSFIPIIINCQGHLSEIKSAKSQGGSLNDYINEIVRTTIQDKLRIITEVSNDEFWLWYESSVKSKCREKINDLKFLDYDSKEMRNKLLGIRINEKAENKNFFLYAMNFAFKKNKRQYVVIFDNVDPFDIKTVREFYWKAKHFVNSSSMKVIITLRKNTYNKLKVSCANIAVFRTVTVNTNLSDILKKRCNRLLEIIEKSTEIKPLKFYSNGVTYNKEINPIVHVSKIIDAILSDFSMNCIAKFSKKNIRSELELLRIIFESGFIPDSVLQRSVLIEDEESLVVPTEFILSSIITSGYGTYFTRVIKTREVPGVINILSTTFNDNPLQVFSKLYILNCIHKRGMIESLSMNSIIESYQKLISHMNDKDELMMSFKNSCYRLFDSGLIVSPDIYYVESQEEFELLIKDVRISTLGNFYFDTLLTSPFYLFYTKDDVYIEDITKFYDAHFVLTKIDKNRYFWTNFKNLVLFLEEYGMLELKAIKLFTDFNTFDSFNQYFGCGSDKLFTLKILDDLQKFCNSPHGKSNSFEMFDRFQLMEPSDIFDIKRVIDVLNESYFKILNHEL